MKKVIRLTERDLTRLVRRVIREQNEPAVFNKEYFMGKKTGKVNFNDYGFPTTVDGVEITDNDTQWENNFTVTNIGGRGFRGGDYNWTYGETVDTGVMGPNEKKPGISIRDSQNREVGTLIF